MAKYKVLVADPIAEQGIEELKAEPSIEVVLKPGLTESELIAEAKDASAIIVRSGVQITEAIIESGAGTLKAIGRAGVGVDNIDIPAATKHGVVVMNTPSGNTISTAEHAFALMSSMARRIPHAHASMAAGEWGRKEYKGVELYRKTLAILGMGRIGSEIARRAMAFGMRVVAYDPYLAASRAKEMRVELFDTVDGAVAEADFITLHMPKTPETTHMINAKSIAKMKPTVRIINCARGGLINEADLMEALDNGKVAGAALDVYEDEPPAEDYSLRTRKDVVLTPHLGASTVEAQENVGIEIAQVIRDMILSGTVVNALNMPNLDEATLAEIGPYLELAETLGKAAAQIAPSQTDVFRINYTGTVSELDTTLITRSALKGYLEVGSGPGSANYLNATSLAEEKGLRITESRPADKGEFTDLIEVEIGKEGAMTTVAGTFFGKESRMVKLHDRHIEITPGGHVLVMENVDAPGMVGAVGQLLGEKKVNIASMSLSRDQVGGKALFVLNLDSGVRDSTLDELTQIEGIESARLLKL